jgi:hypothetical protein
VIGAEPTTSPLPRVCSTTELHGLILNPEKYMERETSLELATLCLEGRYSSQLSYSRPNFCDYAPVKPASYVISSFHRVDKKLNGGQGRVRTFEGRSQQIYSLSPLATRAPAHLLYISFDTYSQKLGAGNGTRTRNLLITNQLLYQLSYASTA